MDTFSLIVTGALALLLIFFLLRLAYTIFSNLANGRKFHHSLEKEFDRLRLSNMLRALGIDKTRYIYQTPVKDIRQQMENCSACNNTEQCDDKLATESIDPSAISFCNNEAELIKLKEEQHS